MTAALKDILIIGGGFSGMAAAIQLRKSDFNVDIIEIDAEWRSYGAGITMSGASLRVLNTLGVLDEFLELGAGTDGLDIYLADGAHLAAVPNARIAGSDIPATGGIMRPVLAKILAEATLKSGTNVRLGCTYTTIANAVDGATVICTDGTSKRYDLVIGADGMNSTVRPFLFPDAPSPAYTGQAVWRAVVPRPSDVDHARMYMGNKVKAGVNPVSKSEMYLFVTEDKPVNERVEPSQFVERLSTLLESFTSPLMQDIRSQLPDSPIVYRPLEGLLMPQPWYRDRVVLIGDTVHATTPHLASGACIGMEDAVVLADELTKAKVGGLSEALDAFQARRWERCRMIVENSLRLGEIEVTNGDRAEHAKIMAESHMALAQPI